MKVERVKISDLSADPANVRLHPERNMEAVKASLRRFGQQKPIVVDKQGVVRAGNGTLAAAQALGWDEIDVVYTDLEGSDATAYAIADNRTGELAEWDFTSLARVVSAIREEDEDLVRDIGWSDAELPYLLGDDGDASSDTPPIGELDGEHVNQPPSVDSYSLRIDGIGAEMKAHVEAVVRTALESIEGGGELRVMVF